MKHLLLTFLIGIQLYCFGQVDTVGLNFTYKIQEVRGDLNKDSLEDKVVIAQDTLDDIAPYRLQVFFKEPNGQFKLFVSSTQIIEPQYPDGRDGYFTGNRFYSVTINHGVLSVNFELTRGHYEHKFRFQNGDFELIGFSMSYADGRGSCTTTDFNLVTGLRVEKTVRCDNDKILSNTREKIWIRPLPKLQDVVPMENDFY